MSKQIFPHLSNAPVCKNFLQHVYLHTGLFRFFTNLFILKVCNFRLNFILKICFLLSAVFALSEHQGASQANRRTMVLTLDEVIESARVQSPDALLAKHQYRQSYWQHRTYEAGLRPGISLQATVPDLNRSIESYTLPDGTERFIERNIMSSMANLSVNQSVGLTGGEIFMNTSLYRIDNLEEGTSSYSTTPVNIGFRQPLFGFNPYKWQKMVEPLRFEEAKQKYIEDMERISSRAVELFFDLALAQINLEIARFNYDNTGNLLKVAEERHRIGAIGKNQLLQMELSHLNAGTDLNDAKVDVEHRRARLRSFLGFNETAELELIIPEEIPYVSIEAQRAVSMARENNPEMLNYERLIIEAERDVAEAEAARGFQADLFAVYGLSNTADEFRYAYRDPEVSQRLRIGIEIPILDWGLRRGRHHMAQSRQEVIRTQVERSITDFEQDVYLEIMRFNQQHEQMETAAKADTIAQESYDMSRERFMIGQVSAFELNSAQADRDRARRGYITAIRNFWRNFYNVRRLTLYDFIHEQTLEEDFDDLLL